MFEIVSHLDYDFPMYELRAGDRVFDVALFYGEWIILDHGDPLAHQGERYPTVSTAVEAVEALIEAA